jgi:phosphoglucosamine mutase
LGVIPTPGLAYLTGKSDAAAGVMVTASHNLYGDNGIKVFNGKGGKLNDKTEDKISEAITDGVPSRGRFGNWTQTPGRADEYVKFLVDSAEGVSFDGLRVVVDTANGAASGIAKKVFSRLGADVIAIADKPDGRNINQGCGAPHLFEEGYKGQTPIQEAVIAHDADLGVAFDGDADRVIMTDQYARVVNGDHIMYILARANGLDGVVATVMSNLGAENAMRAHGIEMVRTKVGDRYVLEGLSETGYQLGGEQSGHIILPETLATGDGMLAAIQTIRAVRELGITLAEWRDQVHLLPQALINIPGYPKESLDDPAVQEYLEGVTAGLGDRGRLLVRGSGTEPLIRVMVEAPDADYAAAAAVAGLTELFGNIAHA